MSLIDRLAETSVRSKLAALKGGLLTLIDGKHTSVHGEEGGIDVTVTILNPRFYRAIALGGHVGAAESYAEGIWTTEDLTSLVRLFVCNREVLDGMETGMARLVQPLRQLLHSKNRNTESGSRRNIRAHYDLGNNFFREFLDETMTYSAGIFDKPESTLKEASIAKYDRLCRKLSLSPEDHVIEIGSGWGGFAIHAAQNYGCKITTTTISEEQYTLGKLRIQDAGLGDRITILLQDYRKLTGTFDKLVSIEMIEAVGHHYFESFFNQCSHLLAPHGLAAIQGITIQDRFYESARKEVDFIKRYIFPGSCIPSITALSTAASITDLRLVHLEDLTPHYAETLRRWRARFLGRWDRIEAQGFDEYFKKIWEFYFCYCEGGFDEAALGSLQFLYAKPKAALPDLGDLPPLRRHMP